MSQGERQEDDDQVDRSDRFTVSPVGLVVTQCSLCDHLGDGEFWICRAYPGQIPPEIIENRVDHSKPYEDDDGIRFTPRADVLPELVSALKAHFDRR